MTASEGQQATSTATWQLDPAASSVTFEHKAMWGLATVRGTFSAISGSGEVHQDGTASGRLVIDAASLDTKHGKRDKHLRSADFFNTDAHAQIVAEIGPVTRQGDASAAVAGTLTVAGVTRPITLTAAITEDTSEAVTLKAESEIDRADFGMAWNQLGTIKGKASVSVIARFTRSAGEQRG
jgi:polyisoprenoid-binding protein YceI